MHDRTALWSQDTQQQPKHKPTYYLGCCADMVLETAQFKASLSFITACASKENGQMADWSACRVFRHPINHTVARLN